LPLTEAEERAEYQLRMDQMTVNIEKMRADLELSQKRFADDLNARQTQSNWEMRRFLVSAILAAAALVGAGVAIGNYLRPAAAPPQVIILQQPAPK
jgi:DNA-binding XRE family transcriptional regulator